MAARDDLTKEIELRLGGGMVDVELDPEHYNLAITKSLEKYRQRSENAVEESFLVLQLKLDLNEYTLPSEVIEVRQLYRRAGTSMSSGVDIEPFEAAYLNTYLLHSGRAGGMGVYDALAQHVETLGRLFGAYYNFTWNTVSKKLTIHRKIKAVDDTILHVYNFRPEDNLLIDEYARPWLKDYALAQSKLMLSEARGKFAQIAGPQGGTTLNAETLRTDAQAEIDRLEQELTLYSEGGTPATFIIG